MFGQDEEEMTLGKKLRLRPYREPAPDALNFTQQQSRSAAAPYSPPPSYAPPQQPVNNSPQQQRPASPQDDSQLIPITEEEFLRWEANQQRSQF